MIISDEEEEGGAPDAKRQKVADDSEQKTEVED